MTNIRTHTHNDHKEHPLMEHAGRNGEAQGPSARTSSAPENRRRLNAISIDEARLLPHLRPNQEHRYVAPDAAHLEPTTTVRLSFAPEPADLRGIPVVGKGVSGVQPGTQPESETIKRSEQAA